MVNIHKKSGMLLVTAHSQLGEAYLNLKCFESALGHFTDALKLNGELTNQGESRSYHIHLLIMLGRCYLEGGSFREALELLQKAEELILQV